MVSKLGIGLNIVVAKTFSYVEEADFLDSALEITIEDSSQIRELAVERGYL